ncbi:MAG TPA: transporter substrate-binding domain-containing protein [Caulobacteraceae bacterium]|jgi:polar amino acid transport system substrate-binding protein|nr:transporter substrate-binding domain-containing protein [Caulobacteraceae bacterium]
MPREAGIGGGEPEGATRRWTIAALGAVGCMAACSAAPEADTYARVRRRGSLHVATNAGWEPQSFVGDDGSLSGFDIDVAREVARRLGVKVRFDTPDWALMTGGHWHGRWDMMVGSATPTEARAQVVDFAGVYYYSPYVFAVNAKSPIRTAAQLNGKVIGVETGTTSEDYIRRRLEIDDPEAPVTRYWLRPGGVKTYASSILPFQDLRLPPGMRLDAVLAPEQTVLQAIRENYPIRVVPGPYAFREPLTVITDKGDPAWTARIRGIIEAMRADGTLGRFARRWYGKDYSR